MLRSAGMFAIQAWHVHGRLGADQQGAGPKIPSAQSQAQKQIYSLSDQRNTARPYEPIPVLWGDARDA
jgi:hypothetical protein